MSGRPPFTELFPNIENRRVPWRRGPMFVPHGGGAPSLDLGFSGPTLDPRVTFARASIGTYFDGTGTMQTAAVNVARFDYNPATHASLGLLIEESRTNVLLNSATLSTQSVTTTATAYALSFYGTGSVTLSGTSSGTTNGTGATTRTVALFTPTAGTLTLTVAGSVTNAQLEAGAFVTSYIPTTAAAVTRQADVATIANISGRNPAAETFAVDFLMVTAQEWGFNPRILGNAAAQTAVMATLGGQQIQAWDGTGSFNTTNSWTMGAVAKAVAAWSAAGASLCLNAGPLATNATLTAGFGAFTTLKLLGDSAATDQSNGYVQRFRYWPRVLSATEMQQVTM